MGWPPSPPWPAAKAQATDTLEAGSTSNALLSKVHPPYKAPLLWRRHLSWQTAGVAPFFVWSTRVVILKRWCSKLRGATKKTPHLSDVFFSEKILQLLKFNIIAPEKWPSQMESTVIFQPSVFQEVWVTQSHLHLPRTTHPWSQ